MKDTIYRYRILIILLLAFILILLVWIYFGIKMGHIVAGVLPVVLLGKTEAGSKR